MRVPSGGPRGRARGSVWGLPEFRALAVAGLLSGTGDQLARVALSVLVYDRTSSPLLTALTYALTFLPAVVGGPLLAGLADRLPRRRLMVSVNLTQTVLVAAMALPRMPLLGLLGLLVGVGVLAAPFSAARAALVPDVTADRYVAALVVDRNLHQTAQVLGFAGSGLLLLVFSPTSALLTDAGSFLVSAVLIHRWVHPRPPAHPDRQSSDTGGRVRRAVSDARLGWDTIWAGREIRRAVLLTWTVAAFAIVPEELAAPYARQLHGGTVLVALLLTANPAGNLASGVWARRWSEHHPAQLLGPLAQLVVLPLAVCALNPPTPVVLALIAASGIGMTVSILARTVFVAHVPPPVRGRAFALAGTGITVAQGLAVAAAGGAASAFTPSTVIGAAGLLGSAAVLALLTATRPTTRVASVTT